MFKKLIIIVVAAFFLVGCQASGQSISPESAKNMLEADSTIILLDVRTRDEFNEGHISGAVLLPLATLNLNIEQLYPNKNQTFIVYCRSGARSRDAVQLMVELGYKNVFDLGGIIDWPYGIVTS